MHTLFFGKVWKLEARIGFTQRTKSVENIENISSFDRLPQSREIYEDCFLLETDRLWSQNVNSITLSIVPIKVELGETWLSKAAAKPCI